MKGRKCFREPIPEIFESARMLQDAVGRHVEGDFEKARFLIIKSDIPIVSEWVESILGKKSQYIHYNSLSKIVPVESRNDRIPIRMPDSIAKKGIHQKYGYCCQFCGIPVIRTEIRDKMRKQYPEELRWGKTNKSRHSAFFALWAQYDHIIPHARGGDNSFNNIILTCSACNYGRGGHLLEEVGISLPGVIRKLNFSWNGLENFV